MKIIYQIGIIFALCWVSEIVEALLPFSFPASVIGMILLFVLLALRVLKVEHIREKYGEGGYLKLWLHSPRNQAGLDKLRQWLATGELEEVCKRYG